LLPLMKRLSAESAQQEPEGAVAVAAS
jgi:hypothetical protein